jgi:hypothetical protein
VLIPAVVGESLDSKLFFCAMGICDQNARRHILEQNKLDIRIQYDLKYLSGMYMNQLP